MYMSQFSWWRCPQCIHWHLLEHCLLWFLQSHQMCHLGQNLPGPKSRPGFICRAFPQSFLFHSPIFSSLSPRSTLSAHLCPRLDTACPPVPSHCPSPPPPPTGSLPSKQAWLHSWLPDPQNNSVGWSCTEQYPVQWPWLIVYMLKCYFSTRPKCSEKCSKILFTNFLDHRLLYITYRLIYFTAVVYILDHKIRGLPYIFIFLIEPKPHRASEDSLNLQELTTPTPVWWSYSLDME